MPAEADAPVLASEQAVLFYLYAHKLEELHRRLADAGLEPGTESRRPQMSVTRRRSLCPAWCQAGFAGWGCVHGSPRDAIDEEVEPEAARFGDDEAAVMLADVVVEACVFAALVSFSGMVAHVRLKPDHPRIRRVGLASASLLAAVNIWTGAPLLALWVGSKVAGDSGLSMGAVFVTVAVLAATVLLLAAVLTRLSEAYDTLTGRPAAARQTSPWLRSMRGEREQEIRRKYGVSPIERVVIAVVFACVTAFEVWFFFFAGSSLPSA